MESMEDKLFDLDQAMRRLDGNEELYEDLVRFFLEDAPVLVDQLRTAAIANDFRSMEQVAHNVKNLAGNFSAQRVVRAARDLEDAARTRVSSRASAACGHLEYEVNQLQEALSLPENARRPRPR